MPCGTRAADTRATRMRHAYTAGPSEAARGAPVGSARGSSAQSAARSTHSPAARQAASISDKAWGCQRTARRAPSGPRNVRRQPRAAADGWMSASTSQPPGCCDVAEGQDVDDAVERGRHERQASHVGGRDDRPMALPPCRREHPGRCVDADDEPRAAPPQRTDPTAIAAARVEHRGASNVRQDRGHGAFGGGRERVAPGIGIGSRPVVVCRARRQRLRRARPDRRGHGRPARRPRARRVERAGSTGLLYSRITQGYSGRSPRRQRRPSRHPQHARP